MEVVLPTWLGSYYGADFSFDDYERITINKFWQLTRGTSTAMKSRWFDYQRLHPLQATYYFFDCYIKIADQLSKKYFGKSYGNRYKDFVESRERNTIWMLRNFCDLHGFIYSWFLYNMIELRLQTGEFKNRLPRPQHLLKDDKTELEALDELWKGRFSGELIQASIDPYFRVERWCANPVQIQHENMLVHQIMNKRVKHFALKRLVYDLKLLRLERVLQDFPDEIEDMQRDFGSPKYILE